MSLSVTSAEIVSATLKQKITVPVKGDGSVCSVYLLFNNYVPSQDLLKGDLAEILVALL